MTFSIKKTTFPVLILLFFYSSTGSKRRCSSASPGRYSGGLEKFSSKNTDSSREYSLGNLDASTPLHHSPVVPLFKKSEKKTMMEESDYDDHSSSIKPKKLCPEFLLSSIKNEEKKLYEREKEKAKIIGFVKEFSDFEAEKYSLLCKIKEKFITHIKVLVNNTNSNQDPFFSPMISKVYHLHHIPGQIHFLEKNFQRLVHEFLYFKRHCRNENIDFPPGTFSLHKDSSPFNENKGFFSFYDKIINNNKKELKIFSFIFQDVNNIIKIIENNKSFFALKKNNLEKFLDILLQEFDPYHKKTKFFQLFFHNEKIKLFSLRISFHDEKYF